MVGKVGVDDLFGQVVLHDVRRTCAVCLKGHRCSALFCGVLVDSVLLVLGERILMGLAHKGILDVDGGEHLGIYTKLIELDFVKLAWGCCHKRLVDEVGTRYLQERQPQSRDVLFFGDGLKVTHRFAIAKKLNLVEICQFE